MKIEAIDKENLWQYQNLILPYIYEELTNRSNELETLDMEYICLGAIPDGDDISKESQPEPASAIICHMEGDGGLNILSIYTLPEYRRKGYASKLLDKVVFVARQLFQWEENDSVDGVNLKTLYRLRDKFRIPFEEFLKANHFVDFVQLDNVEGIEVWAAIAYVFFYREEGVELTEDDHLMIGAIKSGDGDRILTTLEDLAAHEEARKPQEDSESPIRPEDVDEIIAAVENMDIDEIESGDNSDV